ncbi:MAG TPA: ComEC/Rec2 family competence protein [Candidatus Limnocylindrales bacterium]|nr:ComEC/Rec2 family competence protein [Candidatus Limnocylindrales bacterium]
MPRAVWPAAGAVAMALLVSSGLPPPGLVWLVAAAAIALVVTGVFGPRPARVLAGTSVGALIILARIALGWAPPSVEPGIPDGSGPWTVAVESVGSPREGMQSAIGSIEPAGPRVALTLPRYPLIEPGHRLTVDGTLQPPPDGGYGDYLRRIGVSATLRSRSAEISGEGSGAGRWIEALRRAAGNALVRVVPEPEAGLAAGILIGLRDRVDREVAAAFTTAGVSHVVAISGWNIAIVAASVGAVAGKLARRRRSILILGAIAVYVAFAGASPSVVRAGAMAAVVLLARESGRRGQAATALSWAVVVLLAADPGLVRDAGFQLSAIATGGLLAWASPIDAWLRRVAGGRLPGWLVESLAVSSAAQAATLPIVLATFGRLSLVSPLVNLVVVPLVVPAMAGGGVALLAGAAVGIGLPAVVGALFALPGWLALTAMVRAVDVAASLPFASVTLPAVASPFVGAAAALALLAVVVRPRSARRLARRSADPGDVGFGPTDPNAAGSGSRRPIPRPARRAVRIVAAIAVVAVAITAIGVTRGPNGAVRVTILDVGQGDAILVEGGRGGRLLVDGGPDPDRLAKALDARLPPWDRRLDLVVLTHPHEDHVAGIPLLLGRYEIGRLFEPGMRGPGPGYAALVAGLAESGAPPIERLAAGDRLRVDEVDLRVLWPPPGRVPAEPPDSGTGINNVSIVLLGEARGRRFLLAGDAEEEIDPLLVGAGIPRLDLLKVAHHGSATASTDAFLATVRPSIAVTSAGLGNPYGHPARSTLERLRSAGARVFRTDLDGSVEVTFSSDGAEVRTSGGREAVETLDGPRLAAADGSPIRTAAAFACALAGAGQPPDRRAAERAPAEGSPAATAATSTWTTDHGPARRLLYDAADDGPRTDGRGRPPALPRPADVSRPPRARRGRGRRLARGADRRPRHAGRSPPRRGCRAPPRCRQDPAG